MSHFPLCEKAGLGIYKNAEWNTPDRAMGTRQDMVSASQVEAMLASSPVVYGHEVDSESKSVGWLPDPQEFSDKSARLIMIEKIKQDSAESLLREFSEDAKTYPHSVDLELIARVRAFLKRRDGERA